MNLTLKIWRQRNANTLGSLETYEARDVLGDMSFLEMLDVVNESLIGRGQDPIAFDSDCREGICGMCSLVINGIPHGGKPGAATCQLHMRNFNDGDTITIEPWRARAFPVIKDLVTDRSAFDRLIQAGGFTMYVLILCSVASITVIIERVLESGRIGGVVVGPPAECATVAQNSDAKSAGLWLERNRMTAAKATVDRDRRVAVASLPVHVQARELR